MLFLILFAKKVVLLQMGNTDKQELFSQERRIKKTGKAFAKPTGAHFELRNRMLDVSISMKNPCKAIKRRGFAKKPKSNTARKGHSERYNYINDILPIQSLAANNTKTKCCRSLSFGGV